MTANLKTFEIIEAIVARLKTATWTNAPGIIEAGSLAHIAARVSPGAELPAVFVVPIRHDLSGVDGRITAEAWTTDLRLRVVGVLEYSSTQKVIEQKTIVGQEIAQRFIGAAGDDYTFAASISGFQVFWGVPEGIDYEPPEAAVLPDGQFAAVAVTLAVHGQSVRV